MEINWYDQFNAAVTICDLHGVILYMNKQSTEVFSKDGGENLIGKSLLDCHPEPARSKLTALLENPRINAYTIEKKGIRKMIYQAPWFSEGSVAGLVEISLPLPEEVPHFIRK